MAERVRIQGATKRFRDVLALKEVSLTVEQGEVVLIIGPSGSGKSTLLKVAAGILLPDEGEVLWDDRPLQRLGRRELLELRKRNGFVFQDAALWANKSLAENLSLPLQLHDPRLAPRDRSAVIERACRELGFDDPLSSRPAQLSTGEQKIVSFIRAVIGSPSLLFIDDPTASVDHAVVDRMLAVIKRLKDARCTMLVVTQSSKLASLVADHVVVLKAGALLEAGPTAQVVRSRNRDVLAIIAEILTEAAVYDSDLLDLLGQQQ